MRVPPEMVLPVFVSVVFFIALLIGYPWHILSCGSVLYLLSLPLGLEILSRPGAQAPRRHDGRDGRGRRAVQSRGAARSRRPATEPTTDDRPARLN